MLHFNLCYNNIQNSLALGVFFRIIVTYYTLVFFVTMRAIIYSRVSTSSQSNDRQINELQSVSGFEVIKVFQESISGFTKSIDQRAELNKAIEFARKNEVEVIMVHEISRLGRRTKEVLDLIDRLKSKGIKVYIMNLGITINGGGLQDSLNQLILTLMSDLARMESEQLSFRIKSGIKERKKKGLTTGRQIGSTETTSSFLAKHKKAVTYLKKGESIRWVATKLKMSPTTVQKVKNLIID